MLKQGALHRDHCPFSDNIPFTKKLLASHISRSEEFYRNLISNAILDPMKFLILECNPLFKELRKNPRKILVKTYYGSKTNLYDIWKKHTSLRFDEFNLRLSSHETEVCKSCILVVCQLAHILVTPEAYADYNTKAEVNEISGPNILRFSNDIMQSALKFNSSCSLHPIDNPCLCSTRPSKSETPGNLSDLSKIDSEHLIDVCSNSLAFVSFHFSDISITDLVMFFIRQLNILFWEHKESIQKICFVKRREVQTGLLNRIMRANQIFKTTIKTHEEPMHLLDLIESHVEKETSKHDDALSESSSFSSSGSITSSINYDETREGSGVVGRVTPDSTYSPAVNPAISECPLNVFTFSQSSVCESAQDIKEGKRKDTKEEESSQDSGEKEIITISISEDEEAKLEKIRIDNDLEMEVHKAIRIDNDLEMEVHKAVREWFCRSRYSTSESYFLQSTFVPDIFSLIYFVWCSSDVFSQVLYSYSEIKSLKKAKVKMKFSHRGSMSTRSHISPKNKNSTSFDWRKLAYEHISEHKSVFKKVLSDSNLSIIDEAAQAREEERREREFKNICHLIVHLHKHLLSVSFSYLIPEDLFHILSKTWDAFSDFPILLDSLGNLYVEYLVRFYVHNDEKGMGMMLDLISKIVVECPKSYKSFLFRLLGSPTSDTDIIATTMSSITHSIQYQTSSLSIKMGPESIIQSIASIASIVATSAAQSQFGSFQESGDGRFSSRVLDVPDMDVPPEVFLLGKILRCVPITVVRNDVVGILKKCIEVFVSHHVATFPSATYLCSLPLLDVCVYTCSLVNYRNVGDTIEMLLDIIEKEDDRITVETAMICFCMIFRKINHIRTYQKKKITELSHSQQKDADNISNAPKPQLTDEEIETKNDLKSNIWAMDERSIRSHYKLSHCCSCKCKRDLLEDEEKKEECNRIDWRIISRIFFKKLLYLSSKRENLVKSRIQSLLMNHDTNEHSGSQRRLDKVSSQSIDLTTADGIPSLSAVQYESWMFSPLSDGIELVTYSLHEELNQVIEKLETGSKPMDSEEMIALLAKRDDLEHQQTVVSRYCEFILKNEGGFNFPPVNWSLPINYLPNHSHHCANLMDLELKDFGKTISEDIGTKKPFPPCVTELLDFLAENVFEGFLGDGISSGDNLNDIVSVLVRGRFSLQFLFLGVFDEVKMEFNEFQTQWEEWIGRFSTDVEKSESTSLYFSQRSVSLDQLILNLISATSCTFHLAHAQTP
ncbi:hypothetical protein ADUPG1_006411 [Aduncisulcus paluster]|uniref:Uncharacterized protein n=1 Tax=Aduncisulcus paluster TaxID=2918883 RepID=A0ABQ5KI72_9EUKA|nr:hypothetical protein ADUPG1_006411 [Aduncisulcus paluster]